ncbi:MAG: glycine cleavage system protein H [Candidatus Bathyarchaeia archaeon]
MFEYKTIGIRQELTGDIRKIVKITPEHIWVQITPEGTIRIGLTDYAAMPFKCFAYVMTEPVGKEVKKMEPIGVVETWMFMFDICAPVSGKIVKVNETLKVEPYLINEDPYGEGWILEIKPKDPIIL